MSRWSKRIWLNKRPDLTAFIVTAVERFPEENFISADIKIGDCNRVITLDFNSHSGKDRVEVLQKLYLLQQTLIDFRSRLVQEHDKADK